MKVIFLDIDGVLNSNDWYVRTREIDRQDSGDNFIHIDFMHGITKENVEQAIKILNNDNTRI